MTTHTPPILTAEHLSFGFPGRQILDAVGFALQPRTITYLLGGNGAGKATLFNIITGFLQPHTGTLCLGKTMLIGHPPLRA